MEKQPLAKLSIRDGVVRQPDTGYLLACDPKLEEEGESHTNFFKWHAGTFTPGSLNFNTHTCCIISIPSFALVMVAGFGEYGVTTPNARLAGNIFDGQRRKDSGVFRVVATIAGKAYAAGLRGMVYRLDDIVTWVRMDKGLPRTFNIGAIDGFDASDIYAVGRAGAAWHFDGSGWSELDLPTNANLTAVKCAGDGNVYVGGYDGILIRGRASTWNVVAQDETTETVWDLEWFGGELYVSTILFVYRFKDGELALVDFVDDPPETCYHLTTAEGVMWSIGAKDVMSFDGKTWTRIV
jgi:hypothetical protein